MTNEKIIELAAQFDDNSPEFTMSTGAVIAFARALIDARFAVHAESKHGYISNDALNCMGGRLYRDL